MADRFDEAELDSDEIDGTRGWGQFLDGPKEHPQVGPYGTCSGIIVRALAGREFDGPAQRSLDLLRALWEHWEGDDARARELFCQNLRLAFLCLALRLVGPANARLSRKIERELLGRLVSDSMWGDWWLNESVHDQSPRLFTSSIVVLCLCIRRDRSEKVFRDLSRTADKLEQYLGGLPDLPVLQQAAAAAAIVAVKGPRCSRATKSLGKALATAELAQGELGVYFYDYQYQKAGSSDLGYGRDYFIVPTELMLAILGFQADAHYSLRLRAITILDSVKRLVHDNGWVYKGSTEQRISAKNQAWAAVVLSLGADNYASGNVARRFLWELFRVRRNRYIDIGFPIFALVSATALNAILPADKPILKAYGALVVLIVGALYGPAAIRRLIKGRE